MPIIQKTLQKSGKEYYKTHLNIINEFIPTRLTEKEIDVLACFMSLEPSIIEEDMFNTLARKMVKEQLDNLSAASLSNHLRSLIDKGYLIKNEITNRLKIIDNLFPHDTMQGYQFKLVRK